MSTSPRTHSGAENLSVRLVVFTSMLAAAAVLPGCRPSGAQPAVSGEELFASCDSCHGKGGEGNRTLGAPSIAGLPKWYIEAQLKKFRTGQRGAHPDDTEGLRMRPMSRQLANNAEIDAVAEYISKLPRVAVPPGLEGGNAAAGKASFATCTACHGADGMGNPALKAPPIAGQADWYLASELQKFRLGIRGTAKGDDTGATMRPMAQTLANEQAVRDVVAHISTLGR